MRSMRVRAAVLAQRLQAVLIRSYEQNSTKLRSSNKAVLNKFFVNFVKKLLRPGELYYKEIQRGKPWSRRDNRNTSDALSNHFRQRDSSAGRGVLVIGNSCSPHHRNNSLLGLDGRDLAS